MLAIFSSNSPLKDYVAEKWKVRQVGLIFHAGSKKVVVFDAAPWESANLTFFQKFKNEHFKNRFFCLLAPQKKCAMVVIATTFNSCLT